MSPSLLPQRAPAAILDPVVRLLAALRVSPSMVTLAGVAGSAAAAALIANGALVAGGIVAILAGALDMFDGALARATGRATPFGALFDSTLDRISEAIVLFGVLWYELEEGHREESLLVFVALAGSMLVSYVRARGEGLGVSVKSGLFARPERIVVLGLALITGLVRAGLWVLAIVTVATALHRLLVAGQALAARSDETK
jgi:CDP-diacylglycerol--glycerol-3-phosphate 3-phosphatidyltransferase